MLLCVQIVDAVTDQNLELCCVFLERAAMDRAVREIDESLANQVAQRRTHMDTGMNDPSFTFAPVSPWTRTLPPMLQPRPGSLTTEQLMVYEAFNRMPNKIVSPILTGVPGAPSAVPALAARPGMAPAGVPGAGATPQRPGLTSAAALDELQGLVEKLDAGVRDVMTSAGRGVAMSALPPDHIILQVLAAVRRVAERTNPDQRDPVGSALAKRAFKVLYDGSVDGLAAQVYLSVLSAARDMNKNVPREITALVAAGAEGPAPKLGGDVIVSLLSVNPSLLSLPELDQLFLKLMDSGRATLVVNIVASVMQRVMLPTRPDRPPALHPQSLPLSFSMLSKIASTRPPVRSSAPIRLRGSVSCHFRCWLLSWCCCLQSLPSLPAVIDAIRQVAAKTEPPKPAAAAAFPFPSVATDAERSQVLALLESWVRLWHESQSATQSAMAEKYRAYLLVLQQQGVLSSEAQIEKFFRIMMELCVQSAVASARPAPPTPATDGSASSTTVLTYTGVDALSKLVALLVQVIGESTQAKMTTLNRALTAVTRTLVNDADTASGAPPAEDGSIGSRFDQRPYLRLFTNLLQDLRLHETSPEAASFNFQILHNFVTVLHAIKPSRLPLFAFSWLELASHRFLMPKLLAAPGQSGWGLVQRLVVDLLKFLQPYLAHVELSDSIRLIYRGTLRVLLILLHDFPEFLCEYHYTLCDAIPSTCIQLRNLVLSAFPRQMRLPDPFSINMKVRRPVVCFPMQISALMDPFVSLAASLQMDALVEVTQAPRVLGSPAMALTAVLPEVDSFLKTRTPSGIAAALKPKLLHASDVAVLADSPYNTQTMNALVLYIGTFAVSQLVCAL